MVNMSSLIFSFIDARFRNKCMKYNKLNFIFFKIILSLVIIVVGQTYKK